MCWACGRVAGVAAVCPEQTVRLPSSNLIQLLKGSLSFAVGSLPIYINFLSEGWQGCYLWQSTLASFPRLWTLPALHCAFQVNDWNITVVLAGFT